MRKNKLEVLKALRLVKNVKTLDYLKSHICYYSANTRNPLFWLLYVLYIIISLIPSICFGIVLGLSMNHEGFMGSFEGNETIKDKENENDI